jgi:hypothetical protein
MKITFVLALSIALGPAVAQAQTAAVQAAPAPRVSQVDARWAPWLGCWRPEQAAAAGTRVCFVPGTAGAVHRLTVAEGQVTADEAVTVDATPRPFEDRDCRGTERSQWLSAGRVVRAADLTCGRDTRRSLGALSFFVQGPVWVEAQAVDADGTRSVRVQRYWRSADQQLPEGIFPGAAGAKLGAAPVDPSLLAWTVDHVIEASRAVPSEVVEAALIEVHTGFPLNSKALVRLADGGVSSSVIDLMIALSNPRKFVVSQAVSVGGPGGYEEWPGLQESIFETMRYAGMAYPGFYEPLFGMLDSYWNSCVGFWTCRNYYYWDFYAGGYYPGDWVPVYPPISGGGGGGGEPQHGRVVKGQGYTRGQASAEGRGYTRVTVRSDPSVPGSRAGGVGTAEAAGSGSSGSSGGAATPSGYSSGSSGGGGSDRTAQPRGPGN